MTPFLLILVVPALGVMLYISVHLCIHALTPRGRQVARVAVLALGSLLGMIGLGLLVFITAWIILGQRNDPIMTSVLTFVAQVSASLLMLWTAWCATRVYCLQTADGDLAGELYEERALGLLRVSSAAVALVPVLMVGVFGLVLALPVLFWGIANWTSRRSRESQFLWALALAVRNELPLAEEVDAFAEPLWSRQKRAYHALSNRLRDGRSLGEALEMSTGILPRSLASELRTAEEAGTLPAVLTEAATRSTASLSRSRFDSSLAVTMVYCWALLAVELAVIGFVMYWIIPKYKAIFEDFGIELPALTRSAISAMDFFLGDSLVGLPILGLPILAALAAAIVYFVGWSNLNLPLVMQWFPRRDAPGLLRSLSHAVGAGQSLSEMVDDMAHRHLRADMRQRLVRISRAVELGQPLWDPLRDEGFINGDEAAALAAAQRAGNLPWALRTLAAGMESAAKHRAQFWLEIVRPALIVSIGLLVGCFVLAMFAPLIKVIGDLTFLTTGS